MISIAVPFNQKVKDFRGMKALGYKFFYEKGQGNFESDRIYKSIEAVRKAAIPYSYPPSTIVKVYRRSDGKKVARYVGSVSNVNGSLKYFAYEDLETAARYTMNPDGTLGKRYWVRK